MAHIPATAIRCIRCAAVFCMTRRLCLVLLPCCIVCLCSRLCGAHCCVSAIRGTDRTCVCHFSAPGIHVNACLVNVLRCSYRFLGRASAPPLATPGHCCHPPGVSLWPHSWAPDRAPPAARGAGAPSLPLDGFSQLSSCGHVSRSVRSVSHPPLLSRCIAMNSHL